MKQYTVIARTAICIFLVILIGILFLPSVITSHVWLTLFLKLITVCLGIALSTFLIVSDKRRIALQTLSEYEHALFSTITEKLNQGILILDNAGYFLNCNSRFSELLDLKHSSMTKHKAVEFLPETLSRFIMEYCQADPDTPKDPSVEQIQIGTSHFEATLFALPGKTGSVAYVLLLQDCTKMTSMEKDLSDCVEEIRCHIDTKSSLLANVSHELKTPLNAIFGFTHILEDTGLDGHQRELLEKISISSDSLKQQIDNILDLSRLKKGGLSQNTSFFRVKDMLDVLYDKFYLPAAHKNIHLMEECLFEPDLCLCLDRSRMEQILSNLISNACKFTETGYVCIRVSVLNEFDDMVTLKFTIEDTGIGIKADELSNIFSDFYQSENFLTKQYQGAGLGLPICRYLADNMGGSLWAESTEGVGSRFYFAITAPKSYRNMKSVLSSPLDLQGHGEQVLVVEDAPLNFEVVNDLLSKVNINCDHAASGLAALNMCEKADDNYYTAIFMDIHMPIMNGYETARKLKDMGVKTPIIALTATSMDLNTQKKYGDLFSDFVFKPFKYTQLYQVLSPYIDTLSAHEPGNSAGTFFENPCEGKEEAIENLGNSPQLYEKHLERFKNSYENTTSVIEEHLSSGHRDEAKRLSHSVKGLAATLGLTYLAQSAADLEDAIDSGKENLTSEVGRFQDKLTQVLQHC